MRYLLKYILSFVVIILFSNILLAQGGYISLYQAGLNITLQDEKSPTKTIIRPQMYQVSSHLQRIFRIH